MRIRQALESECDLLTGISFASKRYWAYPEQYYAIWQNELTITKNYIRKNLVYVAERSSGVVAYYSIIELKNNLWFKGVELPKGFWLEHMFVVPEEILQGIGTEFIKHLYQLCNARMINRIQVLVDPNAAEFYVKSGFKYIRDIPSSIEGRKTPHMEIFFT